MTDCADRVSGTNLTCTVAVPTFGREQVLVETLEYLLQLDIPAAEVLVIDQTPAHEPATAARLSDWCCRGHIRLIHQPPSIPKAMNRALIEATSEIVLFVDDDIVPAGDLVVRHLNAHQRDEVAAVVGQVLQPGETPVDVSQGTSGAGLSADLDFCFRSTQPSVVRNVMAGNLSVKRQAAIAAGGFDENFVGVAYRFETEFARRLTRKAGAIHYEPTAVIHHLAAARGGTRSFGRHLTSPRPEHSVGDYYFAMLEGTPAEAAAYCVRRLVRSVRTKFHLTHPWWIPVKLLGELRGLLWAVRLRRQGQKLLAANADRDCDSRSSTGGARKP